MLFSPFPDVPDAPKNLECVEASPGAIGLEWSAPRRDGGAPVRGYIVERRQGFSSRFVPITRDLVFDTYFRDTNVNDGQEYEYRIVAENEAGQSEASRPTGPIAAAMPFCKSNNDNENCSGPITTYDYSFY